jgi:hypothetical protein
VFNKGTKEGLFSLDGTTVAPGGLSERIDIEEGPIGQRVHLQIAPDILHRIEFWSIGRKEVIIEPWRISDEGLNLPGAMSQQPIPYQNNGAVQLPDEMTKKLSHQTAIDIYIRMQAKIELNTIPTGRDAESGNGRNFLVCSSALVQHGRLPSWMPTAANQRSHQQATFVEEHKMGVQSAGFFLMRGHSCFTHCWIPVSSRSMARRAGFWGLHPRPCSSRPI